MNKKKKNHNVFGLYWIWSCTGLLLHKKNHLLCVCVCLCVDTQVLLMTDILVFLQEKDQRYFFPCLVRIVNQTYVFKKEILKNNNSLHILCCIQDKPPVLSLQNLIVRDIANQERGMFLISDSSPPEMYEFHATSKEDKNIWIRHIKHTVSKWANASTYTNIQFYPFNLKEMQQFSINFRGIFLKKEVLKKFSVIWKCGLLASCSL